MHSKSVIVTTDDGSPTYLHPTHGASYRSLRGAKTESLWVFLEGTGIHRQSREWRVLELGFGSGLNFQLTARAAKEKERTLHYVSLEPDPLPAERWLVDPEWRQLEFAHPLRHGGTQLTVHKERWQDWSPPQESFDALYFDPFGPAVAPDCWSAECFAWARQALSERGVLATYGASTKARHAMREAGLLVGILPGAPGKREMTVAARSAEPISQAKPWKRAP